MCASLDCFRILLSPHWLFSGEGVLLLGLCCDITARLCVCIYCCLHTYLSDSQVHPHIETPGTLSLCAVPLESRAQGHHSCRDT